MKTFIVNVYKYKKWITLGLSILYLLLFCFPLRSYLNDDGDAIALPFFCYVIASLKYIPQQLNAMHSYEEENLRYMFRFLITTEIIVFAFFIIGIIMAILCITLLFNKKKFIFTPALVSAFFTMLIYGIKYTYLTDSYSFIFYPTTYIFLILLILDIVYLILEWYYLHSGQEKLSTLIADRKAVKQAKQDAELKQSPEYRIEQLEKELQELKAKNDDKDDQ